MYARNNITFHTPKSLQARSPFACSSLPAKSPRANLESNY